MEQKDINKELIRRYRDNKASAEELEVLFHLMSQSELEKELEEVMNEDTATNENKVPVIPLYRRNWFRVAAAAVIIFLAAGSYFLLNKKDSEQLIAEKQLPKQDVAPGGNKAVLTLGDNRTIVLDSAKDGTLAQQGNTKVLKLNDGQLAYNLLHEKPVEVVYNTVTTPRGGQYQLTLADGSKVWLNAASSIRFPTAFVGNERKVEITGEAYFEVAPSISPEGGGKRSFIVNVAGKEEVEVLGTHFNINSYSDETTINTTLLEGSVKVTSLLTHHSSLITPGQQAQVNNQGQISINKETDTDEVMAWKNGFFNFNRLNIGSIMRQVSRWYNVDIVYEEKINDRTFSGIVDRKNNVSVVLKTMEQAGIKFRIEGKKIIVSE